MTTEYPPLYEYHFPKILSVSFHPKEDITAYELALCLPYFHGKYMTETDWHTLGPMQRHWKLHD